MKERPILFKDEMIRAILERRKWQTRRVLKQQPPDRFAVGSIKNGAAVFSEVSPGDFPMWEKHLLCPFGQHGDRLWVREAWRTTGDDGRCDDVPPRNIQPHEVWYESDGEAPANYLVGKYRPPMFMPRWASRILIEITNIRVERVQEISEDDAQAEGAPAEFAGTEFAKKYGSLLGRQYRYGFVNLWDSINAARGYGWEANPWVWVIEFKRIPQ